MNKLPIVLIVDAHTDRLAATARLLADAGYTVRETDSGADALAAATAEPPDLVLLASTMDMRAADLCRWLPSGSGRPFVLAGFDVLATLSHGIFTGPFPDSFLEIIGDISPGEENGVDGIVPFGADDREILACVAAMCRLKRDRDELRQARERERYLNAVLRGVRSVNQLITREDDPERLIQGACARLVENLGYQGALIVLVDSDGQVDAVAGAGVNGDLAALDEEMARRRLPPCVQRALAQDGTVMTRSPAGECTGCPLEHTAHASLSSRLDDGGRVYGVLRVYVPSPHVDDIEGRELFREVADDLAFALRRIRMEQRREAVERERAHYARIVAASRDPLALLSRDYVFREINESYERLVGRSRQDIVDHTVTEVFGEAFFEVEARPYLEQCFEGREIIRQTWRSVPGLGRRLLRISYSPCREPDGWISAAAIIIGDLTALWRAEEALLESEARYRELFEGAPVGIFQSASDGRMLNLNPRMAEMLGAVSPEDAISRFTDLARQLYADSRRREEFIGLLRERGEVRNFEYEAMRLDGGRCWLSMSARISEYLDDGAFLINGFAMDITDLRRIGESMKVGNDLLGAIFMNAPYAMLVIGPDGRVRDVNRAIVDLTGLSREKIIGRLGGEVFGCVNARNEGGCGLSDVCGNCPIRSRVARTLETGVPIYQEEGRITVLRDDVARSLDLMISTVMLGVAGDEAVLISVIDVTEGKRLQNQLRQAQKMEAVGRLAGGVAHDFNNMLSVIIGYSEVMLSTLPKEGNIHRDLTEILGAARRSADLTQQLLTFSRCQDVTPRVLDLNQRMHDMERLLLRLLGEDIQMEFIPAPDLWPIFMDPAQLDQIVANLAVNSRDAMPDGGWLSVETSNIVLDEKYCRRHAGIQPGEFVLLIISDSGHGMSPEVLDHLFEPFFTTKEPGCGTGLGLATVYGVIQQNGGFINAYSEPGVGTTMKVYFPRCREEIVPEPPVTPQENMSTGTETILVTEDEEPLRQMAKTILERAGYRVLVSSGPLDAIGLCERESGDIHLLLTDVVMPQMNGRELATRIREVKPGVKVLFMSGYTANIIAHRGVLDEGIHFLPKPFTRTGLLEKTRQALDGK